MHDGGVGEPAATIEDVVEQLQRRIDALAPDQVHRRIFLTTYQRTTHAVGEAVERCLLRGSGLGGALGCRLRRTLHRGA